MSRNKFNQLDIVFPAIFHYFPVSHKTTKAPSKRTHHCLPTTPNIAGYYMLPPFACPVACCCAKFETGQTLELRANGDKNSQQCRELLAQTMFRLFARKCEMLIDFLICILLYMVTLGVLSESLARLGASQSRHKHSFRHPLHQWRRTRVFVRC